MGLGSGIRDPRSGKNLFRIPDPGPRVKKAPDPGSGSATLHLRKIFEPLVKDRIRIRKKQKIFGSWTLLKTVSWLWIRITLMRMDADPDSDFYLMRIRM